MLKNFLDFINLNENEKRIKDTTTIISYEETEQFIINKLNKNSNYFDNVIYRGINKLVNPYNKLDYTNFTRRAAYTDANYLNLILSNDKRFFEFQKRDNSIICTTSISKASIYGNVFVVIPIDNNPVFSYFEHEDLFNVSTDFGISPKDTQRLLKNLLDDEYDIDLDDYSYISFKKAVNAFDIRCKLDSIFRRNFISLVKSKKYFMKFFELFPDGEDDLIFKNLSEFIDIILFIHDMQYSMFNINFLDINTIKKESYEIWTQSPCILLNINSELAKKYNIK
jgi:hypothetical protein